MDTVDTVDTADADGWLLEVRLFKVRPENRDEFHRISRDGTVPLMRELGITVVAHGPSRNNDDGYYLLRAFPSERERVSRSQALYETEVWKARFDTPVSSMIEAYDTAVLPATAATFGQLVAAFTPPAT